ncbi:MAG: hypothetical protein ABUS79_19880 [Pseudomonadota bacterium]
MRVCPPTDTTRPGSPCASGRGVWGLVAGATVPLRSDATVNGLRVREFRAPADVGVRAVTRRQRIEVSGEAGLTIAWLWEHAPELATSSARSTVELGARLALTLRLAPAARIAPFATAHVEVVPRPTALWALPQGEVGHVPALWAGVTAGLSLGL